MNIVPTAALSAAVTVRNAPQRKAEPAPKASEPALLGEMAQYFSAISPEMENAAVENLV